MTWGDVCSFTERYVYELIREESIFMGIMCFSMGNWIESCSAHIALSNKTSVSSIGCHGTKGLFYIFEVFAGFPGEGL